MNFGDFIKQRRTSLKLTQAELGELLHITPQGLSNYEKGKSKIPLSLVLDLCLHLKISLEDFFSTTITQDVYEIDTTKYSFDYVYKNIGYYREKNKLTLKEVSKKLNISIQRLSDFELNKASPSIEEFMAISNFYHVSYEGFFALKIEPTQVIIKESKVLKKPLNKLLYIGIAGFLLFGATLSIVLPLTLNKENTPIINKIKVPTLNKVVIKDSIDSEDEVTSLKQNQSYYFFMYLDNSDDLKITSISINSKKYLRNQFDGSSSNTKLYMKFNSSYLPLGDSTIKIDGFSFINNEGQEIFTKFDDVNLSISNESIYTPKVVIKESKATSTTITGKIEYLNDKNSFLKDKAIILSLIKDDTKIDELKTKDSFTFKDLEPSTTYILKGSIKENFFDGQGLTEHLFFETSFTTSPFITKKDISSTYNSVSYNFEIIDPQDIKLESISISDFETNKVISTSQNLEDSFNDLLSNHQYELQVKVTHINKGVQKTFTYPIATKAIEKPEVVLETLNLSEECFEIKPNITYALNNLKFNSIKLFNSNKDLIKEYTKDSELFVFDELLSNSNYVVEYSYSYDLLDGKGIINETKTLNVNTLSYEEPFIFFEYLTANENSIFFSVNESSSKIKAKYNKVEIYKNDILLETTTDKSHKFTNLENNYSYVLKLYYSYDLNDGNGEIEKIISRSIVTSSDIFIEDLRPFG